MKKEIWKPITGYEGLYEVSNHGRVKSLSKTIKNNFGEFLTKERILKKQTSGPKSRQYHIVRLYNSSSEYKVHHVHRIVCQEFNDKDLDGKEVHHIDNDPLNNCEWNLEILTREEHNKRHIKENREQLFEEHGHLLPKIVEMYDGYKIGDKTKFIDSHDISKSQFDSLRQHLITEGKLDEDFNHMDADRPDDYVRSGTGVVAVHKKGWPTIPYKSKKHCARERGMSLWYVEKHLKRGTLTDDGFKLYFM